MTGQATALGTGLSVTELRNQLQNSTEADMRRRRAIILTSFVGMTSMGLVSLLQTGVVRHLPDPPLDSFDSDKVNSSDTAYALGAPDGTLSVARKVIFHAGFCRIALILEWERTGTSRRMVPRKTSGWHSGGRRHGTAG